MSDSVTGWLNEECKMIPFTATIERWVKIPAWFQVMLYLLWLVKQCLTCEISSMLACLVGTVYPAIKSIDALKTVNDPEDDKIWLTYWCVYGFTVVADMNIGWILSVIPFYYPAKLLFFLWLQLPLGPLMGARVVYRLLFKPIYNLFGKRLNEARKRTSAQMQDYDSLVASKLQQMTIEGANLATQAASQIMIQQAVESLKKEQ